VPTPPVPTVAVADTDVPVQTAPVAGVGVNVPAVGIVFTAHVTVLYPEVVQPLPVAVRLVLIDTDVCPVVLIEFPEV
jgi:hypothetical protein